LDRFERDTPLAECVEELTHVVKSLIRESKDEG
jgi:hypothetical protein